MRYFSCLVLLVILVGCQKHQNVQADPKPEQQQTATPGQVVEESLPEEWRTLELENTLYITLETGSVVVELVPEMAPLHVSNTKHLVRAGVFDGTQFYRVLDAFVAQGGPIYTDESFRPELTAGSYNIKAEFTQPNDLGPLFTAFDVEDGYADETGFVKSYAVGRDSSTGESWLLHCYGAVAMGRTNEVDSGGTALYVINGPAQRYLDRNTTVFGRVVAGMQHIQALHRSQNLQGPVDLTNKNQIIRIQVAADMPAEEVMPIELMDSRSESFGRLLEARKNRTGSWFVHQHDHMDACGVPIPVRLKAEDSQSASQ